MKPLQLEKEKCNHFCKAKVKQFKANKKAVASNLHLIYTQTNQNVTCIKFFFACLEMCSGNFTWKFNSSN